MPLRISWLSNSIWTQTGYGRQTAVFVPRLQALGHAMAVQAFYGLEGAMLQSGPISIYPRAGHPYGQDVMGAHALHFKADILIALMDAWVFEPKMLQGRVKFSNWFPIDADPIPPPVLRVVQQSFAPIVMSKFGERVAQEAGLRTYYVPHGVETDIYKPLDRAECRGILNLPKDAFIVGMVAANKGNPSRKAFTPQIEAFARLKRQHSDAKLYIHTTTGQYGENGGVNLPEFIEYLGLTWAPINTPGFETADVIFSDQYMQIIGLNDQFMSTLYNSFDLLMNVSMGEGFGLTPLEAQSCGCPTLVGDWTAMPELCFGGWTVPKVGAEPWWFPLAAYQYLPRVDAVYEALETAYGQLQNEKLRRKLSLKARNGALDYDADLVTERYWAPVLTQIEQRIRGDAPTKPSSLGAALLAGAGE